MIRVGAIWLVRLTRAALMPFAAMTSITPRVCKYEPTCAHYAEDAIRAHGVLRGLAMAGWRVLRCNPWSRGGYDPAVRS